MATSSELQRLKEALLSALVLAHRQTLQVLTFSL